MCISESAEMSLELEMEVEGMRDSAISAMHNGQVAGETTVAMAMQAYENGLLLEANGHYATDGVPFSGDDMSMEVGK